ncbi:Uncharacterised protein [Mycobacteroides abscessus]|nr:Uncharacterised protein [Mycobacteroides abscessus]
MRVPGFPNGHATKRDAVRSERPTYPHATPSPATYNSPTTPAGTGCSQVSNTKSAAPGTREPIGTTASGRSALSGALIATHMVVSVGP